MKKFLCIVAALAFLAATSGTLLAGPKAEKGEKAAKKEGQAKADKKADQGEKKPKKSPEERFKALDKDASGKVSKEEFTAGKEGKGLERAEKQFARMDKDSSGDLTLEEFTPKKKEKKPKEAA